eukprot:4438341-Pyramimonas_sp.AAC.1
MSKLESPPPPPPTCPPCTTGGSTNIGESNWGMLGPFHEVLRKNLAALGMVGSIEKGAGGGGGGGAERGGEGGRGVE